MSNNEGLNVFQKAVLFAIDKTANQGQQSNNSDGCAYRGISDKGDAICCPVGHIIADDYYYSSLENLTPKSTEIIFAIEYSLIGYILNDSEKDLLYELQIAHDELQVVNDFELEFYEVFTLGLIGPDYVINHCSAKIKAIKNNSPTSKPAKEH